MTEHGFTILQHITFDILLPTADVFGDINFAIAAFSSQNIGIGCAMILPVLFSLMFNVYKWFFKDHDSPKEKKLTWILVMLNLWPQYQIVKLLLLIARKKPKCIWKPVQDKIKKDLSFIEPFIEAIPQSFMTMGINYWLTF